MKIIIWGTGKYCDMLMMEAVWKGDVNIVGFCESKKGKNDKKEYRGKLLNIYELRDLDDSLYDIIILAHSYYKDAFTLVEKYKMKKDKIVIPYTTGLERNKLEVINNIEEQSKSTEEEDPFLQK